MPSYAIFNKIIFKVKIDFFYDDIKRKKYYEYDEALKHLKIESSIENKITFKLAKSFYKTYHHPGSFFATLIAKLPFIILKGNLLLLTLNIIALS